MRVNANKIRCIRPWCAARDSRLRRMTYVPLLLVALVLPGAGRTAPEPLPVVIMLDIPGVTPNDIDLYNAIQAQLSAVPLRLSHLTIDNTGAVTANLFDSVSKLAADRGATLVFWIEDEGTSCTLYFYHKGTSNRRIHVRVLARVPDSLPSRHETLGNAASSVIEESIAAHRYTRHQPVEKPVPPLPQTEDETRKWVELSTAYSGAFFASRAVINGGRIGLAVLPIERLVVALSYTQSLPLRWETGRYQLSLTSRNIEASIAGRLPLRPLDLRLGLAWSADLRSHSLDSFSDAIASRPGDIDGIYSLGPFVTATWFVFDSFGIVICVSANIALNEKAYKLLREDDREIPLMAPFRAKLTYQLGLVFQL